MYLKILLEGVNPRTQKPTAGQNESFYIGVPKRVDRCVPLLLFTGRA